MLTAASAGRAVAERLLASSHFTRSSRVGAYVSCERLREVDTHAVLHALFASGARAWRGRARTLCAADMALRLGGPWAPLSAAGGRQRCFVPLVGEAQSQMSFLHIGACPVSTTLLAAT